jgi:hypothetical protein
MRGPSSWPWRWPWWRCSALIGYCYSITAFYGIPSFIPMALHTALTFAVLATGLLHARPDRGLMAVVTGEGVGSLMARRLLVATIVIPLVLGWLRLSASGWASTTPPSAPRCW